MILEPLIQGAAGMLTSPSGYLARTRELCDEHGVLLICDEVATGFGRTGRMFACEHEDVLAGSDVRRQGFTGGYLPFAATLTTERLYEGFLGAPRSCGRFFHGHTYTGQPARRARPGSPRWRRSSASGRLSSSRPKIELLTRLLDARGRAAAGGRRESASGGSWSGSS